MKFSMTGQDIYDYIIEVTAWAGLYKNYTEMLEESVTTMFDYHLKSMKIET